LNKKEAKKTLLIQARAGSNARAPDHRKFFAGFFQKRSACFALNAKLLEPEPIC
jgi:hypothetical protein